ncbi:MAG: hypothetical protein HC876_06665 [Chloroflexaceae bacterium]|nr:hypothetical protein [Chloroflexaceae bacterium]NJO05218.1 hypothetical protein [Chloroflexaceae bacterium]
MLPNNRSFRNLFVLWVIANTLGWFLVFWPFGMVPFSIGVRVEAEGWLLLVIGAVLGFFQWLVLRIYIPMRPWWFPANVVAWGVSWLTAFLLVGLLGQLILVPLAFISPALARIAGSLLFGAVSGTIIGAIQWFAFYDRVDRANWWIAASALGMTAAAAVRLATPEAISYGIDLSWFAYSIITGILLLWILDDERVYERLARH